MVAGSAALAAFTGWSANANWYLAKVAQLASDQARDAALQSSDPQARAAHNSASIEYRDAALARRNAAYGYGAVALLGGVLAVWTLRRKRT